MAGDGAYLFFSIARDYEGSDTGLADDRDRPTTFDVPVLAFDVGDLEAHGLVSYRAGDLIWPYAYLFCAMEGLDEDEAEDLLDAEGGEVTASPQTVNALRALAAAATSSDPTLVRSMMQLESLWLQAGPADRAAVTARARALLVPIAQSVMAAGLPARVTERVLHRLGDPFWMKAPPWPRSLGVACLGEVLLRGDLPVNVARFVAVPPAVHGGHATWYALNEL